MPFADSLYSFLIAIDGMVNDLTNSLFRLFQFFAGLNLFGDEQYQGMVQKTYIFLGMVMLFVLAYTLLRAVINPDDFSKGEMSFANLIKNIVVSLVILAVLPSVFTLAFNVQNSLLNKGTIPKLILGKDADSVESTGVELTYYMYKTFLHKDPEWSGSEDDILQDSENVQHWWSEGLQVLNRIGGSTTYKEVDDEIKAGRMNFTRYRVFGEACVEDKLAYTPILAFGASVFVLWVMANFCFDMALRVIKLMFYQLIAPIPVICMAIPIGGLKDVFNKWLKAIVGVFAEVFIKMAVLYLGIDMIQLVASTFENFDNSQLGWGYRIIAQGLLVMGIIMFIKKAPQLITDLFGIDSGNMKMGLKDKLKEGGAFVAGAAVGGGASALIKNGARGIGNTIQDVKKAKREGKSGLKAGLRGGIRAFGSAAGGAVSGLIRGGANAQEAKNFKEMAKAGKDASETAVGKSIGRENYRAANGGTLWGVAKGHVMDTVRSAKRFILDETPEGLTKESQSMGKLADSWGNWSSNVENLLETELGKGGGSVFERANGHGFSDKFYDEYDTFKKNKQAYDAIQAAFNSGTEYEEVDENGEKTGKTHRVTADELREYKDKYIHSRDVARDSIMNIGLAGTNSDKEGNYSRLSAKGQAALKDNMVGAQSFLATTMENASSSPVQEVVSKETLANINKGKEVTVTDFSTTVYEYERDKDGKVKIGSDGNPIKVAKKNSIKDVANAAKTEAEVKLAILNKDTAAKGDKEKK